MSLIQWNNSYSVNIAGIDEQHKKLINVINELHSAMIERRANEELGSLLDKLMDYTKEHFANEEDYFDKCEYTEAVAHKEVHKKFVEKITDFKLKFDAGNLTLTLGLMNFLSDWLLNHIKGTDKKYTKFLNDKGFK